MRCPNCGKKLQFTDMTWSWRLFWACLISIAINQSAQFYDWIAAWIEYYGS